MKKIRIGFCLLVLILSACAAPAQSGTNTPATSISIGRFGPTETMIPAPTSTVSPTTAATTAPSPTPGAAEIARQCLEVSGDSQQLSSSNSGLIMLAKDRSSSEIYDKLKSPYLYDPSTGKKTEIPGASSFAVSLDNQQMAYVSENDMLVVTDATGKPTSQHPFADIQIIQWANNGLIVEDKDKQEAFLNPFTGERKKLASNLPDLYPVENGFDAYWSPEIVFDPSLTMAVFPGYDQEKNETYIALWDFQNQKELTRTSQGSASTFLPQMRPEWSVDGSQAIVAAINGEKVQLMGLKKDGSAEVLWDIKMGLGTMFFSLSPNQKYIAFWSPAPDNSQISNLSFYVLDIQSKTVTNYCIISPDAAFKPVWSPDSDRLAVELKKDMGNSEVIVVDINKNIAVKIAENAQPVGWLK